jgi:hypothetical protein
MKLSVKLAGLFASATFLITGMPALFQRVSPTDLAASETLSGIDMLETLLMSMGGTFVAGFIGYQIGNIMLHPKAKRKPGSQPGKKTSSTASIKEDELLGLGSEPLSEAFLPPQAPFQPPPEEDVAEKLPQ